MFSAGVIAAVLFAKINHQDWRFDSAKNLPRGQIIIQPDVRGFASFYWSSESVKLWSNDFLPDNDLTS